jgi:ACS family tartrate transporter-like MFS transporter
MHGLGGLAGWQWLFLLEGLPAVVLGVVVLFCLPNGPRDARWLSEDDRRVVEERLAAERIVRTGHRGAVRQVLTDGRVWLFSFLYLALVVGLYGISFWLPQILKGLSGTSDVLIGVMSALPYVVAAVGMVWIGRHSDATGERRWHVAAPASGAAAGLLLCGFTDTPGLALATLSLAALGIWGALGPFWAMPTAWLGTATAAAGIAWINSVGNLGGFLGPYAVGLIIDATGGFAAAMFALSLSLVLAAFLALRVPAHVDARTEGG